VSALDVVLTAPRVVGVSVAWDIWAAPRITGGAVGRRGGEY
jgi:hypothetical protein